MSQYCVICTDTEYNGYDYVDILKVYNKFDDAVEYLALKYVEYIKEMEELCDCDNDGNAEFFDGLNGVLLGAIKHANKHATKNVNYDSYHDYHRRYKYNYGSDLNSVFQEHGFENFDIEKIKIMSHAEFMEFCNNHINPRILVLMSNFIKKVRGRSIYIGGSIYHIKEVI